MSVSADLTDRGTRARVEGLFVHPLKSASAIPVDVLELDERGATGDRRWLLVDKDGVVAGSIATVNLEAAVQTLLKGGKLETSPRQSQSAAGATPAKN